MECMAATNIDLMQYRELFGQKTWSRCRGTVLSHAQLARALPYTWSSRTISYYTWHFQGSAAASVWHFQGSAAASCVATFPKFWLPHGWLLLSYTVLCQHCCFHPCRSCILYDWVYVDCCNTTYTSDSWFYAWLALLQVFIISVLLHVIIYILYTGDYPTCASCTS